MLILARKAGQAIQAGDIRIKVLATGARRVQLGIEAPAGVNIRREELPPQLSEAARANQGKVCD